MSGTKERQHEGKRTWNHQIEVPRLEKSDDLRYASINLKGAHIGTWRTDLFLRKLRWRLAAHWFHSTLRDVDLFLAIEQGWFGGGGQVYIDDIYKLLGEIECVIPGITKKPRNAIGRVIIPSMIKSPDTVSATTAELESMKPHISIPPGHGHRLGHYMPPMTCA